MPISIAKCTLPPGSFRTWGSSRFLHLQLMGFAFLPPLSDSYKTLPFALRSWSASPPISSFFSSLTPPLQSLVVQFSLLAMSKALLSILALDSSMCFWLNFALYLQQKAQLYLGAIMHSLHLLMLRSDQAPPYLVSWEPTGSPHQLAERTSTYQMDISTACLLQESGSRASFLQL